MPEEEVRDFHFQLTASGPTRFGGMISEDFLPELRYPAAYKTYDEMRKNSPIMGGLMRAIAAGFRTIRWDSVPYDDTPEGVSRAAFLNENLHDMKRPLSHIVTDILTSFPFGFAPMEMVFKMRMGRDGVPPSKHSDGAVGFRDFVLIPQNTIMEWVYDLPDNPNDLIGIKQLALVPMPGTGGMSEIPMSKVLNFRPDPEKDNPEGVSIFRQAYRSWYFMTNLEVVEAISLERTGAGIPMMTLPEGATTVAQAAQESDEYKAQQVVKQVRADDQAGIVLPFGWAFEIVTSKGLRPELFDLAIKRHKGNMLISALATFLELGTSRVGSFAMVKSGKSFFEAAFDGAVLMVEEEVNEKAVPLLFELNGVTDERLPKLGHTALAGQDLAVVVNAFKVLLESNLIEVDPSVKDWAYNLLGIPLGNSVVERESRRMVVPDEPAAVQPDPLEEPLDSPAYDPGSNGLGDPGALDPTAAI
jgi:hypothetical protein